MGTAETPEVAWMGHWQHTKGEAASFLKTKQWKVSKIKLEGKYELVSEVKWEQHIFKGGNASSGQA